MFDTLKIYLGSLYANDLLQSQVSPDADEVLERWRKQRRSELRQNWLNPLSMFNLVDRIL